MQQLLRLMSTRTVWLSWRRCRPEFLRRPMPKGSRLAQLNFQTLNSSWEVRRMGSAVTHEETCRRPVFFFVSRRVGWKPYPDKGSHRRPRQRHEKLGTREKRSSVREARTSRETNQSSVQAFGDPASLGIAFASSMRAYDKPTPHCATLVAWRAPRRTPATPTRLGRHHNKVSAAGDSPHPIRLAHNYVEDLE